MSAWTFCWSRVRGQGCTFLFGLIVFCASRKVNSSILHTKEPRWGSLLHLGEASLGRTLVGPCFSWEFVVSNMTKTLKNKCGLPSCSFSALADSEYSYFGTDIYSFINYKSTAFSVYLNRPVPPPLTLYTLRWSLSNTSALMTSNVRIGTK